MIPSYIWNLTMKGGRYNLPCDLIFPVGNTIIAGVSLTITWLRTNLIEGQMANEADSGYYYF